MPLNAWDRFRQQVGYKLSQIGCRLAGISGDYPITKPIEPSNVEILGDSSFQESVREVADLTLLDTGRLANLWVLCRMTDPKGSILEIGCYKGGGALHLSNSSPDRKVIACDSFSGFEKLDPKLDRNFEDYMFKDSRKSKVEVLFASRHRNYQVLDGFFPASASGQTLAPVSFVHLDVDIYKASIESLLYLEQEHVLLERSLIVLDDYKRKAEGVNKAVAEFTSSFKNWVCLPIFPAQGVLFRRDWPS
jgi:hypothetical protein